MYFAYAITECFDRETGPLVSLVCASRRSRMSFETPEIPFSPLALLRVCSKSSGLWPSFVIEMQNGGRIDVSAACPHDQTFLRREAHRGVDRPPVFDRADGTPVAQMAGDHLVVRGRLALKFRELAGHISMRDSVEAVTADLLLGQILIRQPIGVSPGRQCLVEGRIEGSYVRHAGQPLARESVCFETVPIVQRRECAQFVNRLFDLSIDDDGFVKAVSAVHDAMSYGFNFDIADLLEDRRDRLLHATMRSTSPFARSCSEVEEVELQRRTACVQDQDLHSVGQRHSRTSGMSSP